MERRDFFTSIFKQTKREITSGLAPYSKPLNKQDVYHMLRRTTFQVDVAFAQSLIGKTASEAVDLLISNRQNSMTTPSWLKMDYGFVDPSGFGGAEYANQRYNNQQIIINDNEKLIDWWISRIKSDSKSIFERLTFFWHGHFTSQYLAGDFIPAQMMYKQNLLFREMQLGNFKDFLEKITLDGAMLFYLNGNSNKKESPNENYARELLELFSLGIGEGHYTEDDIRQIAKMLTGWNANIFRGGDLLYIATINATLFDTSDKNVFGEKVIVNFDLSQENIRQNSIRKLVDLIIAKRGEILSRFIATKVYQSFVYSDPEYDNSSIIEPLAKAFVAANYDLSTLFKTLLKSEHFFDPQNRGVQIKSPLDLFVGFSAYFPISETILKKELKALNLELLNPPNVAGWKGYRNWINTKTLPYYIGFLNNTIQNFSDEFVANWAQTLGDFDNSELLTKNIVDLMAARELSKSRLERLHQVLLGGAPYYEWPQLTQNKANAGIRIKILLKAIFKLPDYYLS